MNCANVWFQNEENIQPSLNSYGVILRNKEGGRKIRRLLSVMLLLQFNAATMLVHQCYCIFATSLALPLEYTSYLLANLQSVSKA